MPDRENKEMNLSICPDCGTEMADGQNKCSNCGYEKEGAGENFDNENTVVLKSFINEFEAEIAKSVLEEEGIESFISKDDEGSMNPSLILTQGVRLHVFEKDEAKALEILNSMDT